MTTEGKHTPGRKLSARDARNQESELRRQSNSNIGGKLSEFLSEAPAPELLAENERLREALKLCIDEMQESIDNEGRLASFSAAITKARAALGDK